MAHRLAWSWWGKGIDEGGEGVQGRESVHVKDAPLALDSEEEREEGEAEAGQRDSAIAPIGSGRASPLTE